MELHCADALAVYLRRVLPILGAARDPGSITVDDIQRLIVKLRALPTGRKAAGKDGPAATMSEGRVRHHLNRAEVVEFRPESRLQGALVQPPFVAPTQSEPGSSE
jgi:hypothetical protein